MQKCTSLAPLTLHGKPVDNGLMSAVNFFFLHLEQGQFDKLLMLAALYSISPTLDRLCEPFLGARGARHFEFETEVYLPEDIPDQTLEFSTASWRFRLELSSVEEPIFDAEKIVDAGL